MKDTTTNRRMKILEILREKGCVNSADLAMQFDVSMETIRKDLLALAKEKLIIKDFGGARLSHVTMEKQWDKRNVELKKKQQIAKYALSFLKDKQVLILDNGTTCQEVANLVNTLPPMDIVTSSLTAFLRIDGNHHQVFLTGGRKREKSQSVVGNWSIQFLQSVHADICFLGSSGLFSKEGPTTHSYHELDMKRAMIQQSESVYILADSSKFAETGFHTMCNWSDIDGIITDSEIPYSIYEEFHKIVPIYIVEEEEEL